MMPTLHFAALVVITIFAIGAAAAFDWFLLRLMFVLMRPATVQHVAVPPRLAPGASVRIERALAVPR